MKWLRPLKHIAVAAAHAVAVVVVPVATMLKRWLLVAPAHTLQFPVLESIACNMERATHWAHKMQCTTTAPAGQ